MAYWTTDGDVRGSCGHKHRSQAAARACLERDRRGCASQGGYSDRAVVEVDGCNDPECWPDHPDAD